MKIATVNNYQNRKHFSNKVQNNPNFKATLDQKSIKEVFQSDHLRKIANYFLHNQLPMNLIARAGTVGYDTPSVRFLEGKTRIQVGIDMTGEVHQRSGTVSLPMNVTTEENGMKVARAISDMVYGIHRDS